MKKLILILILFTSTIIFIPIQKAFAYSTADFYKGLYTDYTEQQASEWTYNLNTAQWYFDVIIKSTGINTDTLIYIPHRSATYYSSFELSIDTDRVIELLEYTDIDLLEDTSLDEYFIEGSYFSINEYMKDLSQDGGYYFDDDEIAITLDIEMQTTHSAGNGYSLLATSNRVIVAGVTSPFYQLLTNNESDDYSAGYSEGYFDGLEQGIINGRLDVFNRGSAYYGFIDTVSFDYVKGFSYGETGLVDQALIDVFQNGIATKINPGNGNYFIQEDSHDYIDGSNIGSAGAYESGYVDGGNESFQANIDKWIVPAIVIVLIVGGIIGMRQMRKRND